MDRYTHVRREDLAGALDALPENSMPAKQAQLAMGTDNKCVTALVTKRRNSLENGAQSSAMNSTPFADDETPGKMLETSGFPRETTLLASWRNWQTQWIQNPPPLTGVSVRLR